MDYQALAQLLFPNVTETPDVIRLCVLPKGDDGMPRPTSLDRVCCPKAVVACHALRRLTMFPVQGR